MTIVTFILVYMIGGAVTAKMVLRESPEDKAGAAVYAILWPILIWVYLFTGK